MSMLFVMTQVPDVVTAERIAEHLLVNRLIACATILPVSQSLYHWQGQLMRENEVPLLLKTHAEAWQAMLGALRAVHPYTVPEIAAWPVTKVNGDYLAWIVDNLPMVTGDVHTAPIERQL